MCKKPRFLSLGANQQGKTLASPMTLPSTWGKWQDKKKKKPEGQLKEKSGNMPMTCLGKHSSSEDLEDTVDSWAPSLTQLQSNMAQ
jgi:hypothetical protein